jgi:hypothetical protein
MLFSSVAAPGPSAAPLGPARGDPVVSVQLPVIQDGRLRSSAFLVPPGDLILVAGLTADAAGWGTVPGGELIPEAVRAACPLVRCEVPHVGYAVHAWHPEVADRLIEALRDSDVAVTGGQFFRVNEGVPTEGGRNEANDWTTTRWQGESPEAYAARSRENAANHVRLQVGRSPERYCRLLFEKAGAVGAVPRRP